MFYGCYFILIISVYKTWSARLAGHTFLLCTSIQSVRECGMWKEFFCSQGFGHRPWSFTYVCIASIDMVLDQDYFILDDIVRKLYFLDGIGSNWKELGVFHLQHLNDNQPTLKFVESKTVLHEKPIHVFCTCYTLLKSIKIRILLSLFLNNKKAFVSVNF